MSRPRPGRLPRGVSGEREARLALRRKQSPHLLVQRTGPLSQESAAEVVRDLAGFPRLVSGEREARHALRKNSLRIS